MYNKNLVAILVLILYLVFLSFNCFIILSIMLLLIAYEGFKIRKSKNIKLSLIFLTIIFALGNLGIGLYDLNFMH
ncbi:MAG: hypothetical protein ACRCYC_12360 [Paraclostridium sp.]|uniref:hypothetical protein n=1 Tax=Paraclostridium sp. TaxID=2023273 RepID=UPI003F2A6065